MNVTCGGFCIVELNLKKKQHALLESLLDNHSYTCGSSLQDIELPEPFKEVYICNISYESIEKLYYSAGYDLICIYCVEEVTVQDVNAEFYPQCSQ